MKKRKKAWEKNQKPHFRCWWWMMMTTIFHQRFEEIHLDSVDRYILNLKSKNLTLIITAQTVWMKGKLNFHTNMYNFSITCIELWIWYVEEESKYNSLRVRMMISKIMLYWFNLILIPAKGFSFSDFLNYCSLNLLKFILI